MRDDLASRLAAVRDSKDTALLIDLGCDLAVADEHLDAAWCFRAAVGAGAEWAASNLGNELVALGRDSAAIAAYEQALAVGEVDAWLNLGNALERVGDLAGALRAHEQGQLAGDVAAGMSRAHLLRETGDAYAAEKLMLELAAGGSAIADAVAACWEFDRTAHPALEARLRAGAELYPSARAALAELLNSTNRAGEALAVLQRGVTLGEVESALPLGNHYADVLDDPVTAEQTYRQGIKWGDTFCHHNLAVLLEHLGRTEEAEDQYRIGAAAGDPMAARRLADLLAGD